MPDSLLQSSTPRRPPRVCLACHGQRLATLLETASTLRLFRLETKDAVEEAAWPMPAEGLPGLALLLAGAGVALLVCGGATCCCLKHFSRRGIAVAPWIAGEVPVVIAALRQNRLETLLVPGARPAWGLPRRGGTKIQRLESKSS